ncbi:hypothetical protein D3C72_1087810 [compost metagenome]
MIRRLARAACPTLEDLERLAHDVGDLRGPAHIFRRSLLMAEAIGKKIVNVLTDLAGIAMEGQAERLFHLRDLRAPVLKQSLVIGEDTGPATGRRLGVEHMAQPDQQPELNRNPVPLLQGLSGLKRISVGMDIEGLIAGAAEGLGPEADETANPRILQKRQSRGGKFFLQHLNGFGHKAFEDLGRGRSRVQRRKILPIGPKRIEKPVIEGHHAQGFEIAFGIALACRHQGLGKVSPQMAKHPRQRRRPGAMRPQNHKADRLLDRSFSRTFHLIHSFQSI